MRRLMRKIITAWSASLLVAVAHAGTATYNFDTDPSSILTIGGNNPQPWQASGGKTGGFLAITYPEGGQSTIVVFPDIDAGKVVTAFTFECDLRVGNPHLNVRPADGFSVNFARAGDPVLLDPTPAGFAASGAPETGTTTGIAISFDTWAGNALPDGPDLEGIIVRVDNKTVLKQPMPTRSGACDDITSLQTGPRDLAYWDAGGDPQTEGSWAGLCWQPFSIELDNAGKLTVKYKNNTILDKYQTSYFPTAGRLVLAGRTGGADENTHFDNIKLTTVATSDSSPPTAPSNLQATAVNARRVKLTWTAGTDDSGRVGYEIERNGTVLPGLVATTSFSEVAKPDTSYSYKVRSVDPASNKSAFTAAVTVKTPVEVTTFTAGVMKWEMYKNINGVAVTDLTGAANYPNDPDEVKVVAGYEGPTNYSDNYGARVSGFVTPKASGKYVFLMATDDGGELYLSTDDTPAKKALIASEPTWNPARAWSATSRRDANAPENRSAPIQLEAGKRYYTELIYKEGTGGDNGGVVMIKDGDPLPSDGSPPLSGDLIGAFIDPKQGAPSILQQPKGTTAKAGGAATMSVKVIGAEPFTYQWQFRPLIGNAPAQKLAGATTDTLSVNASSSTTGLYSVVISNDEGSATSAEVMLTLEGTLFIEAEDFNYGGGKYINNKAIGMTGAYAGGDYRDLGTDADSGIDWLNPGGNASQPYRPGTGVAAGKPNQHADGIPRGGFDVTVNHVVGWNDAGDWQNYTRVFPDPARDYSVIGRLSSGGNAINGQLDEVTAGAKTANQTLKKLGQFKPGRATAGWDNMEWFPLVDDGGKPVTLNLSGERTLRFTTQDGANLDLDYMMFVPATAAAQDVTKPGDPIVSTSTAAADSPAAEGVANAIDDKTSTKYLNFKKLNTGFTVTPSVGITTLSGIALTSANDSPERDPASFKIEGSNDGNNYSLVAEGAVPKFSARFTRVEVPFANSSGYTSYRVTFPTVVNATAANSMQIAEVELLGTPGGKAPAAGAKFSKMAKNADGTITIEWTGGGVLQAAPSVTGPWQDVAGAASPYTFKPSTAILFGRIKN